MPHRPLSERRFILLQHLTPKLALTRFAGWVANWRGGRITTAIIRRFIRKYSVNMSEAVEPNPAAYATFNEFFTRALLPDARPLAASALVCPVDGAIHQLGPIEQDRLIQAKGHYFTTNALLGGDALLAQQFENGSFANIYLSPRDYHRIHMPCAGRLLEMSYIPGELYSVSPVAARGIDGLFARNERLVCLFEGELGQFAMVLVGATIVGSMATVWHGIVNPPRRPDVTRWDYRGQNIELAQGAEMGRFLLGSTVLVLLPQRLAFNPAWAPDGPVRLGEAMLA